MYIFKLIPNLAVLPKKKRIYRFSWFYLIVNNNVLPVFITLDDVAKVHESSVHVSAEWF